MLISAPTGSGKTLAAFLLCLDRLVRRRPPRALCRTRPKSLYVSPLKALSNDIHINLEVPLSEIAAMAAEQGIALAPIRTAVAHRRHSRVGAPAAWAKSGRTCW